MNWSIKKVAKVLLVIAVFAGGLLSGVSNVWAQEKRGTLAQQLQGSWSLVSIYNEQDGNRIEQFGPNAIGFMTFTPDGGFSQIIVRANLPKFAAKSRMKGTVEENQAIVQGSVAYFGTYTVVSEKEQTVNLSVEGSTYPNFVGEHQKRIMTVVGDELKTINPTTTLGSGTNYSTWKRIK